MFGKEIKYVSVFLECSTVDVDASQRHEHV